MRKFNIAIDGYSSCGKSTLAKALANALNLKYIDSGAMYRAVTWYALKNNLIVDGKLDEKVLVNRLNDVDIEVSFNRKKGITTTKLNGEDISDVIRDMPVSRMVSPVSAVKEVREKLLELQQKMGKRKGVIMDGRDIGTTVFPGAPLKIFLTADPKIRAQRRYDELKTKGVKITLKEIKENLTSRDYIDENREVSPLKKAADAIVIDNSELDPEEQLDLAMEMAMNRVLGRVS